MDFETRLHRLERSAARWRACCVLLAVAGIAWACHGAGDAVPAVPDVLRAHRVEVVNEDGKTCIELVAKTDGGRVALTNPLRPRACNAELTVTNHRNTFVMHSLCDLKDTDSTESTSMVEIENPYTDQQPRVMLLHSPTGRYVTDAEMQSVMLPPLAKP